MPLAGPIRAPVIGTPCPHKDIIKAAQTDGNIYEIIWGKTQESKVVGTLCSGKKENGYCVRIVQF